MKRRERTAYGLAALLAAGAPVARAQVAAESVPTSWTIVPGAVEVGLAGSLASVEGATRGAVALRVGMHRRTAGRLWSLEGEIAQAHERDADRFDALATLAWGFRLGSSSVHPFAGAIAGIRQEWIGSFRQSRVPVGAAFGLRALASDRAGLRIDYRVLRILDDPVADFTEHGLAAGFSIFFRNAP